MTKKEIKARFQTTRPEECASSKRVEAYFKSKSENAVTMCKSAIKNGIIAQYVLADSWFINAPFIDGIRKIKKGLLHVIGMSKTNRKFKISDKTYHAKALIAKHSPSKKTNKKLKMQYFTLNASYEGIPLKLFFVKQGYGNTNNNWKLNYEIVFERLLNNNSATKILALLNALKNNYQTEVPELVVA